MNPPMFVANLRDLVLYSFPSYTDILDPITCSQRVSVCQTPLSQFDALLLDHSLRSSLKKLILDSILLKFLVRESAIANLQQDNVTYLRCISASFIGGRWVVFLFILCHGASFQWALADIVLAVQVRPRWLMLYTWTEAWRASVTQKKIFRFPLCTNLSGLLSFCERDRASLWGPWGHFDCTTGIMSSARTFKPPWDGLQEVLRILFGPLMKPHKSLKKGPGVTSILWFYDQEICHDKIHKIVEELCAFWMRVEIIGPPDNGISNNCVWHTTGNSD